MSRSFTTAIALAACLVVPSAGPAAVLEVLAFGDSMTAGVGDENGKGYPSKLKKKLEKGSSVSRFGVPGEVTLAGLTRLGGVLSVGGDVVLIMEGTNDVSQITNGKISFETTITNIGAMIEKARGADIEPVLSSIVPRSPNANLDRSNSVTAFLVGELRELAIANDVRFADAYDLFDPESTPDFFADYFDTDPSDPVGHLRGTGYDRLAQAYADLLNGVDSAAPVIGNFDPGPLPNVVPTTVKIQIPVYDFAGSAGLNLEQTRLLLNGKVVSDGLKAGGTPEKVELRHRRAKSIGCRVVLRVLAEDLAVPPNTLDRTIGIYDVTDREVLPGDLDFDCQVDGADLVALALRIGADSSDPRYLGVFDLDQDGRIDENDLAMLASNFGKSSLQPG